MKRIILLILLTFTASLTFGEDTKLPGKFVFSGRDEKGWGTYLLENGNATLLRAKGFMPAWSPDGKKIASSVNFSGYDEKTDPNVGKHIYILDQDGKQIKDIKTPYPVADKSWSPNGNKIAYIARGTSRRLNLIYLYDLEKNEHKLIYEGDEEDSLKWLTFSADGSRLLFFRGRPNPQKEAAIEGAYVINADGTGLRRIINGIYPTWYPDGKHLLCFYNVTDDGKLIATERSEMYFYKVNVDTLEKEKVFKNPDVLWSAKLSKDGKYFYYVKGVGSEMKAIFVMPLEGPDQGKEISIVDPKNYGYHESPDWYIGE